jgi:hypothetical protein
MASIYDVNYGMVVPNILPPNKRLPNFLSYLIDLVYPIQWNHDNFFNEYANGSGSPLWTSTGMYNRNDRVITWYPFDTNISAISNTSYTMGSPRENAVYACQVPTPPNLGAGTWPILCTPEQDKGTGAELVAYLQGGQIADVGIKSGGSGYGQAAWVSFIGGPEDEFSTAVLNYDNNSIQAQVYTNGSGQVVAVALTGSSVQLTPYIIPPVVMIPSSTGTGAKAVANITNGIVTGFAVVAGGSGYPNFNISSGIIFGGTTTGPGSITNVTVVASGTYTSVPLVLVGSQWSTVSEDFRGARSRAMYNSKLGTLTWIMNEWFHTTFRNFNPVGSIGLYGWGTGDSATATATVVGGVITAVAVTAPGSGYANTPEIFISDPHGTLATAVAVMSYRSWNSAATYNINDLVSYQGASYKSLVNANTGNTPAASPADWLQVLNSVYTGQIQSIQVTSGGSGYTSPSVEIIVPGVVNPPGGGTGPFQQAHSDIFITSEIETASNIFYAVPVETNAYVSYVVPFDSGSSSYMNTPIQYINGNTDRDIADFIIWVPRTTFWDPLVAQGNSPDAIVRHLADQYVLAGLHYAVIPY